MGQQTKTGKARAASSRFLIVKLFNLNRLCRDWLLARFLRRGRGGIVALGRIVPVEVALNHYLLVGQHDALPADIAGLIVIFPNHIRVRGQN